MPREPDRERWNARYRDEGAPAEPSPFLVSLDPILPRRGRALDVGGGGGRNAIWLAQRGLDVTLADISDVALDEAGRRAAAAGVSLARLRVDLCVGPPPAGPWDVIACLYFLHRPIFPALAAALAPGGVLIFAHSTRSNLERHARPGPAHLLDDGELARLAPGLGLELVQVTEGWLEAGRHEARLVARRSPA